jgi:hypothetical protein
VKPITRMLYELIPFALSRNYTSSTLQIPSILRTTDGGSFSGSPSSFSEKLLVMVRKQWFLDANTPREGRYFLTATRFLFSGYSWLGLWIPRWR